MKKFLLALMLGVLLMGASNNCSGEKSPRKPYCAKYDSKHHCTLWKYPPRDDVALTDLTQK